MKIGTVKLGSVPRIVAIIHDQIPARSLKSLHRRGAEIVEVRIDLFDSIGTDSILRFLKRIKYTCSLPLIGTIRRPEDGGRKTMRENTRLEIFKAIIPLVDCVDSEIDSPITEEVISLAKRKKKKLIISYHNFKETPSNQQLVRLIRRGMARGGDIIKLAVMSGGRDDTIRLLKLTHQYRDYHLITISMGKAGQITRLIAPFFGSLLTYGYVDSPIAPGQLSVEELKRNLNLIYPR